MSVTGYPQIGGVDGERGGILVLPSVDSALFTAPTETWTRFAAAMASATLGADALVTGGLGYTLDKLNGSVYRTPKFTNA